MDFWEYEALWMKSLSRTQRWSSIRTGYIHNDLAYSKWFDQTLAEESLSWKGINNVVAKILTDVNNRKKNSGAIQKDKSGKEAEQIQTAGCIDWISSQLWIQTVDLSFQRNKSLLIKKNYTVGKKKKKHVSLEDNPELQKEHTA